MEEPKNWGPQWFLKSISSIQSYGPLFSFKVRFLWDMQILQRWSKNVVLSYADNAILEQLDKSLLSHRVTKWAMVTVVDDRNFWIEPLQENIFFRLFPHSGPSPKNLFELHWSLKRWFFYYCANKNSLQKGKTNSELFMALLSLQLVNPNILEKLGCRNYGCPRSSSESTFGEQQEASKIGGWNSK